jgi:filamentous hemagglutinin family protein
MAYQMSPEGSWKQIAAAGLATALAPGAWASPQGVTVSTGTATVTQTGPQTSIKVSNGAVLNWNSFNIANGQSVQFVQPNKASFVWNFIDDPNPTRIMGGLSANGFVALLNQNGFFFGPNSVISVGGLIVSTARPATTSFGEGNVWDFTGAPPLASIVNYGQIKVSEKSSLFLIAEKIDNHGILEAPDGTLGLYAGKEVLVSERPDGRGLSAKVKLPGGSVDNRGSLIADAGTISVEAQVVNMDGIVRANSIREQNGHIELTAEDSVTIGPNADISASGDTTGVSPGGQVIIKSAGELHDDPAAKITVAGGSQGGDAGSVELSAPRFYGGNAQINGTASTGFQGGQLLIDPAYVSLNSTGATDPRDPQGTMVYNVTTDFAGMSQISVVADKDITLKGGTVWSLGAAPGSGSSVTLEAGRNISIGTGASILGGLGWSISLSAGSSQGQPTAAGSILIGPSAKATGQNPSVIQTADGSISLTAKNDISVGYGAVRTTANGSITATALTGDISTGIIPDSYKFGSASVGYTVQSSLGGISTAAGGDVTLTATLGSVFATKQGSDLNQVTGASGAFGAKTGNVTITAGKSVQGVFNLANGVGTIVAGGDVGTPDAGLQLQLIKGNWSVNANNIYMNEVRNPNGTFNHFAIQVPGLGKVPYYFDYASDAALHLNAANGVYLEATDLNVPRLTAAGNDTGLLPLFPPILDIKAGSGGVNFPSTDVSHPNIVVLFPSAQGRMSIETTGGGNFEGQPGVGSYLLESDGAESVGGRGQSYANLISTSYHSSPPIHLNDQGRSSLDISGSMKEAQVYFAQPADVKVGGDFFNSGLSYRQYSDDPKSLLSQSFLSVGGNITFTSDRSTVGLPDPLDPVAYKYVLDAGVNQALFGRLHYTIDPATKALSLTWIGSKTDGTAMTPDQEAQLLAPITIINPQTLQPVLGTDGKPLRLAVVPASDKSALDQLQTASQDAIVATGAQITVTGPGKLTLSANNINLGISPGIIALPPDLPLYLISPKASSLDITTKGNLDMVASTISSEALGGNISLNIGGTVSVGGPDSLLTQKATGIFTFADAGISLTAGGDINVSGSRIATYGGGDISVRSLNGNIDAGKGGQGTISVSEEHIDPKTGLLVTTGSTIAGSGIFSIALPGTTAVPGNIDIKADNGSFQADTVGVYQLALNGQPVASRISIDVGKDVNAGSSGIVGGNIDIKAGGSINGFIFASQGIQLNAQQSINATALGQSVSVSSAQGTVSGTIIGGTVNVSGSTVDAAVVSSSANVSGNSAGATVGTQASAVSAAPTRVEQTTDQTVARAKSSDDDEEAKKRRAANAPKIVRTVARVTVIMPNAPKSN